VLSAPIDVYLSETNTLQPDIIFIAKERLFIIGEKKIEGAPDLVIEILSPANAYYDLRTKKDVYEQSGVREYWIVDPIQKGIEVYVNRESRFELASSMRGKGEINSHILPDFTVILDRIFG
ncbi:MAG TPA: Uma2 family endonuclease, partial [Dissulfurispiraceae bacterium]|nr:Uma2 family endonuclease [Dissulfurispiraceae bacterium]